MSTCAFVLTRHGFCLSNAHRITPEVTQLSHIHQPLQLPYSAGITSFFNSSIDRSQRGLSSQSCPMASNVPKPPVKLLNLLQTANALIHVTDNRQPPHRVLCRNFLVRHLRVLFPPIQTPGTD